MIEIMLAEVFVKAAVLCLLLYLFARGEADFNFRKVSMVTAGLTLGSLLLEGLLKDHLGVFVLLPIVILTVLILMQFCWVTWWQALLVALPFVGVSLGMSLVTADLTARSGAAFTRSLTRSAVTRDDVEELKKMHAANTDLSFLETPAADAAPAALPAVAPAAAPASAPPLATVSREPGPARPSTGSGDFTLKGISKGPRGRLAIINQVMLGEGETLDGAQVLRIDQDRVILRRADEIITLQMGGE